jgi:hypothetical protein
MASDVMTHDLAAPKRAPFTWQRRYLLGGCGALMPLLLSLLTVDAAALSQNVTLPAVIGYSVKIAALFVAGGLFVALHHDEVNPLKLFQLGIAAPALMVAGLNGYHAAPDRPHASAAHRAAAPASGGLLSLPVAFAAEQQEPPKKFGLPEETARQGFVRGLLGKSNERVHFVIAGRYQDLETARREARRISGARPDVKADVYDDGTIPGRRYAVVIGAHLTEKEAYALRARAQETRIAKDVTVYRYTS